MASDEQRQQHEHEAQVAVDDLRWLMSDKRGRRIIRRFLGEYGVYRISMVQADAQGTAFNEGRRSCGLQLLDALTQHCPDKFVLMQEEHLNARSKR